jgi:hypothetical protein
MRNKSRIFLTIGFILVAVWAQAEEKFGVPIYSGAKIEEAKILSGADISPGISDKSKRAEFILDKKAKASVGYRTYRR